MERMYRRKPWAFGGVLIICMTTFMSAGPLDAPNNRGVDGWFSNEGEVIVASQGGEVGVDMVSVVVLGTRSARIRSFVFAIEAEHAAIVFLDEKLEEVARKDVSKESGLLAIGPKEVSWQRRLVGSGQGGSGESVDHLTATFDESGNLVMDVVSRYSIRRFFGLQKEKGETRGRYLFRRLKPAEEGTD